MSLIKKIDVDKHFATKRAMRLGRTGPLSRQDARKALAATAKNAHVSAKDDAMGLSSPSASVAPAPIAADSDVAQIFTLLRNRQA